ncbi:SIR2 family NAD-dependent protein deacylase [Shewanella sp. 1180_01]|uniref:SIR2 family NAD-dependent protein deacylase n=1 Tax=Shewanella sp. 1180_01 TaxID=2604451 RepID=UPI00406375DB
MRVIILSGAGLSAPSGLPTYEELKRDVQYSNFFSSSADIALNIISGFVEQFSYAKPNNAHRECLKIQRFCEFMGIGFEHYTLNIDNLAESIGCKVTHLHGCVDNLANLVENRFETVDPFEKIVWEAGDVLLILGVSNDGYPLAFLENNVVSSGAYFCNYNVLHNESLASFQVIGDVSKTFSAISALTELDLKCFFDIFPFGTYDADVVKCNIYGREYSIYFSPTLEFYSSPDEVLMVESHTKQTLTMKSSEVKFDLQVNTAEGGESFATPRDQFTLEQLNMFGIVLVTIIDAHARFRHTDLYTASAIRPELTPFYNRLASKYAKRLQYEHWCAFGEDGVTYAFKKQ